jgi:hypothetical protein
MPELVYQSISPSFFAPSITLLLRSSGLSFSSERQISSAAGTAAEKVLDAETPASKKANRKIGSLRLVKFISWQDPNQLSRLYGTAEFAVKREKLEWRCSLIGGRIVNWGFHGQGRSRIERILR